MGLGNKLLCISSGAARTHEASLEVELGSPCMCFGDTGSQGVLLLCLWVSRTTLLCIFQLRWTPQRWQHSHVTLYSTLTVEWGCSLRMQAVLPHLADAPTRVVTAFFNSHSPCDTGVLANDLGDERFGQVSPYMSCTWFGGAKGLSLCVTVDSSHSKKREDPFPNTRPWQEAHQVGSPSVSGAKLWALVQSRYQSLVSKLGPESFPLVWEASSGLRAH